MIVERSQEEEEGEGVGWRNKKTCHSAHLG